MQDKCKYALHSILAPVTCEHVAVYAFARCLTRWCSSSHLTPLGVLSPAQQQSSTWPESWWQLSWYFVPVTCSQSKSARRYNSIGVNSDAQAFPCDARATNAASFVLFAPGWQVALACAVGQATTCTAVVMHDQPSTMWEWMHRIQILPSVLHEERWTVSATGQSAVPVHLQRTQTSFWSKSHIWLGR